MTDAAEDRAPVMNSFKNKMPIGTGENQVPKVDFRHPNMGLAKKLEMPQLARFMDGTVLHNGFLAFKVSRDSPHRILPRYIVLRGRPASIHTFRPDTDPSNYAPHAKRIDISMITSVELGVRRLGGDGVEDHYPESKVFQNWQKTILKNNFFCGNGQVPADHCLTIHGVNHESTVDSPFEKQFAKGKKQQHLFLETMDLIMDSAETRDLFANAIVMYILSVRPQGVHIDPMKQDIPNQLSKADQEQTARRCEDHLDWIQFQSEDRKKRIQRARFRSSFFVVRDDLDVMQGASTPTPGGNNGPFDQALGDLMGDIDVEHDDGRATPTLGSSGRRKSGSWSPFSPRRSRSRSRSRSLSKDFNSPVDDGGLFGWLGFGGGEWPHARAHPLNTKVWARKLTRIDSMPVCRPLRSSSREYMCSFPKVPLSYEFLHRGQNQLTLPYRATRFHHQSLSPPPPP